MTSELWFCRKVRQVTFVRDDSKMVALGVLHVIDKQSVVALTTFEKAMVRKLMKNFNGMREW